MEALFAELNAVVILSQGDRNSDWVASKFASSNLGLQLKSIQHLLPMLLIVSFIGNSAGLFQEISPHHLQGATGRSFLAMLEMELQGLSAESFVAWHLCSAKAAVWTKISSLILLYLRKRQAERSS